MGAGVSTGRRLVITLGGFLGIIASLSPAQAKPPDSYSQKWNILNPVCSVKQSWAQKPTAQTATTITASVRVVCSDPHTKFTAQFSLSNNVRPIGVRNYGVGPFGQDAGPGPFEATLTETLPGRHVYRSNLEIIFEDWAGILPPAGPPQCVYNGFYTCTFEQDFTGLKHGPLSTRRPKPTPATFHREGTVGGAPCSWDVAVRRKVTGVLAFSGVQSCVGDGTITLYADDEANMPLTSVSYNHTKCDPATLEETIERELGPPGGGGNEPNCYLNPPYGAKGTWPAAAAGRRFTIGYDTFAFGKPFSAPPDCIKYDGVDGFCTFYFNIVVSD